MAGGLEGAMAGMEGIKANELTVLAERYMTDKCPAWGHNYMDWYYGEFGTRRQEVKKVLEIGVGGSPDNLKHNPQYIVGASLRMWRDFFPNARVYGVDVLPHLMFTDERIETFLCDQRDLPSLLKVLDQTGHDLDLVIDDGTHGSADQVFTALSLVPLIQAGAVYVIEDVSDLSIVTYLHQYNCQVVTPQPRLKRDDRLIVIRT
jgi:hypothetical protein